MISQSFYTQEDVISLAQAFLGKFLCTQIDGKYTCGMIVETEAYKAPEDYGSHAFDNKRTNRTEAMFYQGGTAYVYLIYGVYKLFNIVTHKKDVAHAILIRGLEPVEGIDIMLMRRQMDRLKRNLTAGPGLLTEALGIELQHNKTTLTGEVIWIEDRGIIIPENQIIASPRVGLNITEPYKSIPWRFRIKDNPWTSPTK
ncbi:MAG: DNA-3-methyladenine glycosylase [Flavobacteriales bacterium AspAUS03]